MAAFQEVFRRSGIDERRSPPGMVVPLGGDNIVALIDPGRKLKFEPAHCPRDQGDRCRPRSVHA